MLDQIESQDIITLVGNNHLSFIKEFLLNLKKKIKIRFFARKITSKNRTLFTSQSYTFSFNYPKKNVRLYALAGGNKNKECIYVYNIARNRSISHLGGEYFSFLVEYQLLVYLLEKNCKNIIIAELMGGSTDDILINQEIDIKNFFDMIESDIFYMLRKDKKCLDVCKKGSDIIQYLQKPYAEAIKMRGFPRRWKIPKEFYKT